MLFSLGSADPTLSKQWERKKKVEPQRVFSLLVPTSFYEEFKFQARGSWPLCSNSSERRRGREPVAENKRLTGWGGAGGLVPLSTGGRGRTASSQADEPAALRRSQVANILDPALWRSGIVSSQSSWTEVGFFGERWCMTSSFWHPINSRMGRSSDA